MIREVSCPKGGSLLTLRECRTLLKSCRKGAEEGHGQVVFNYKYHQKVDDLVGKNGVKQGKIIFMKIKPSTSLITHSKMIMKA